MTRAEDIAARLAEVTARVRAAEQAAGRRPGSVRLLAVSKKMPWDDVAAAARAGQVDFGENYAQELRDKRAQQAADASAANLTIAWHQIGPLQANKVKYVAGQVALIHTVDSPELLAEIERRAAAAGAIQDCLVQVNVAAEAQKHGVSIADLPRLLDAFATTSHTLCRGLMLIPPLDDGSDANGAAEEERRARGWFAALRGLAERHASARRERVELTELSMGMSHDFPWAIAEGATIVRVGTAIFGERPRR